MDRYTVTESRKGRHFEFRLHEGSEFCVEHIWEILPHGSSERASATFPTSSLGSASRTEYCKITLSSYLDGMERNGRL